MGINYSRWLTSEIATIDTVVDRIETDTTSIEAKVDVLGSANVPQFTGSIYYVDASQSDDTGAGTTPDTAKKTITAAVALVSAGDAITVKYGTYTENMTITAAMDGVEVWGEIGAVIVGTVSVAGDSVRIEGLIIVPGSGNAIDWTGNSGKINDVQTTAGVIGFNINGYQNIITNCIAAGYSSTAFDISSYHNSLVNCLAQGQLATTRGFYFSNTAADRCFMAECSSTGNDTAGYEIVSTCSYVHVRDCTSGGGDGDYVDSGSYNMWSNFQDRLPTEHHEGIAPKSDGEGTATTMLALDTDAEDETNGPASTQYYWGEPIEIDPGKSGNWSLVGLYIAGRTAVDVYQWELFECQPLLQTAKGAGNDWDEGATVLTVADGTLFATDDLVCIESSANNPEILRVVSVAANVVTIERETSQFGAANTGLRWNHTSDGNTELIARVHRESLRSNHRISGLYSANNARHFTRIAFEESKAMQPNSEVMMRMLNQTDSVNGAGFDVSIIYED